MSSTNQSHARRAWNATCKALLFGSLGVAITAVSGCTGERVTTPGDDDDSNVSYADTDQDGIMDVHEGSADTDSDGYQDYRDTDSDGDGIPDAVEAGDADPLSFPIDSDDDGIADFRDSDSDNNGVPDVKEAGLNPASPSDMDGDGIPDYRDTDNDGDGISDTIELGSAQPIDSDNDGVADYLDTDSDGDTVLDKDEAILLPNGRPGDLDQDTIPNFRDRDSDGDGFTDVNEAGDNDPLTPPRDTDSDAIPDYLDLDSDGDAIRDADEQASFTDPYISDSDGDGYSDGGEQAAGSDPTRSTSVPQGLYLVVPQRSQTSADFNFTAEIGRADVLFVLDSTGSMGPTLNTLAYNFSTVVQEVSSRIPDAAFGVVTFQDYNYPGLGSGNDKPFKLYHQITTHLSEVQSVLSGLLPGGGGDLAEAALEALFQSSSGRGFDQNCDGNYDSSSDIAPFVANGKDAFQGSVPGNYDPDDSSTGQLGGVGFRRYALPVIVWTTDTDYRDPDAGMEAPDACSNPAGSELVEAQVNAMGVKLIGVNAGEEEVLTDHMTDLAQATYSLADLDNDGMADPLVFSSQGGGEIVNAIVEGIDALHISGEFNSVTLKVENDPYGFVSAIDPPEYRRVQPGMDLSFNLSLFGASPASTDDQIFKLTLVVVGDEATSLDSQQVIIVVPGSAL